VTADPMRFYDVALRDFGLLLAALALARLAAGVRQRTSERRLAHHVGAVGAPT